MRILFIATKSPWPPVDGGRLLLLSTLRQLSDLGLQVELVAPVRSPEERDATASYLAPICEPRLIVLSPLSRLLQTVRGALSGLPLVLAHHRSRRLERAVAERLADGSIEVVHVEQLHAFPQAAAAIRKGIPIVLREQNVESDLWRGWTQFAEPWWRIFVGWEGRRLEEAEVRAVRKADLVITVSEEDERRLQELAGPGARVRWLPVPFPAELPSAERTLAGEPPVVMFASGAWAPNEDAYRWFLTEIWPEVERRLPRVRLHLFGAPGARNLPERVDVHPRARDSRDLFVSGSILAIPLRIASGIRMKILEAWARGVSVVATSIAAKGLGASGEETVAIADSGAEFATAISALAADPERARAQVAKGRELLRRRHDPLRSAEELIALYRSVQRGDQS